MAFSRNMVTCAIIGAILAVAYPVPLMAAEWYVAPVSGGGGGTSWATAFTNVQDAVNVCANDGDVLYIRCGTYTNVAEIAIWGKAGLTIAGGYAGTTPEPGDLTNIPTLLTRGASSSRIVAAGASTVTLTRLTIAGGYLDSGNGGGMCFTNACRAIVTNCVVTNNGFIYAAKGGGLYANGGSLDVYDSLFAGNYISADSENAKLGGAIACENATSIMRRVSFMANHVDLRHSTAYGGAIYLAGGSAFIADCDFKTNRAVGYQFAALPYGGAVYANNVAPLIFDSCAFSGNFVTGPNRLGNVLFLTGAGLNAIFNAVTLDGNFYAGSPEDIYLSGAQSVVFGNCVLRGSTAGCLYKTGAGTLTLTNTMVAQHPGHALNLQAGTAQIMNSTIAANTGRGVTNNGAALTLRDSIVWDNSAGGIVGSCTATYSCLQEPLAGTGNFSADPIFVAGYYLSSNGLPFQSVSSPCIDAGSDSAMALGLASRTTATDGGGDSGLVDIGYHYGEGIANMSNMCLYVDAVAGDDGNDGWSPGAPLKTITNALGRIVPCGTIHIAAGIYSNGSGCESFPLTVPAANVTLRGAGPTDTVIDARQSGRVMQAINQGRLRLEGLQLANGYLNNFSGAGLYLAGGDITITNCSFVNDRILDTSVSAECGGGIYSYGGRLTLFDTVFLTNGIAWSGYSHEAWGGAVYAEGVLVSATRCLFRRNSVSSKHGSNYGGAVALVNGAATLRDCFFASNWSDAGNDTAVSHCGGALYASGLSSLAVSDSMFSGNYARYSGAGGAVYLGGCNAQMLRCVFATNGSGSATYPGDVYLASGKMGVTNGVMVRSTTQGLRQAGGTCAVANCTFADNAGWGFTNSSGSATAVNCIAWGNAGGGIANAVVSYTCSQEAQTGEGNIVVDPAFADGVYYHLKSRSGQYEGGYFSGGDWGTALTNSPCIDAGALNSAFSLEPGPNGGRINIGAYGNTAVASKSVMQGSVFQVR